MSRTILKILVLSLVCGVLLSTAHRFSSETIAANQEAFKTQQLLEVVGDDEVTLIPDGDGYRLTKAGRSYGQLRSLSTMQGYNGEIRFWLATQNNGEVLGVRVIKHQETPGLGDKLELSVSDWVLDFNQRSLQESTWDVKKYGGDFDQFSGATITPRAVVLRIKAALEAQQDNREQTNDAR